MRPTPSIRQLVTINNDNYQRWLEKYAEILPISMDNLNSAFLTWHRDDLISVENAMIFCDVFYKKLGCLPFEISA